MEMGFFEVLAWARKVQHRLHEYAESITNAEHRESDQQLPPDKPIEVRAVVSLDEKTMAKFAAQNHSENPTQKSIANAPRASFWAVVAYVVVTAGMWCAMLHQNKLTTVLIHQNEVQWRAQNRPWVGLSGSIEFPKQPVFNVFQTATPLSTDVNLEWTFKIKDSGNLPGFNTAAWAEVWMTKDVP
jgi:hypothetical protein